MIRGGAPGIDMQGKTVIANVIRKKGGGARGLLAVSNYTPARRPRLPGSSAPRRSGACRRSHLGGWRCAAAAAPDDGVGHGRSVRDPSPTARPTAGRACWTPGRSTSAARSPAPSRRRCSAAGCGSTAALRPGQVQGAGDRPSSRRRPTSSSSTSCRRPPTPRSAAASAAPSAPATDLELVGLRTTPRPRHRLARPPVRRLDQRLLQPPDTAARRIARGVVKHRFGDRSPWRPAPRAPTTSSTAAPASPSTASASALPAANVRVEEKRSEAFVKATWRPTADMDAGRRRSATRAPTSPRPATWCWPRACSSPSRAWR